MTLVLDDHRVEQRKATLVAKLGALGDVTASDVPRARRRRQIEIRADAPGGDLPGLAAFEYREAFERSPDGWRLIAYAYEFLDRGRGGRRAYHRHDESFHAHCVGPRDRAGRHFRATAIDLFEAHDEFVRIYLRDEKVRCDDLRPLLAWMNG